MQISDWVGGACSTVAIKDLASSRNAEQAMKKFCHLTLLSNRTKYNPDEYLRCFYGYYVFTAGPEVLGLEESRSWVKYGTEFADYIRTHKLGVLSMASPSVNPRYSPPTPCQLWAWQVNRDALIQWWETIGSKLKPTPARPEEPCKNDRCPACGNSFIYYHGHTDETTGITDKWYCKNPRKGSTITHWPEFD
jgi:hypothetical protein